MDRPGDYNIKCYTRKRQILYDITYMWNHIYVYITDIENKPMVTKKERERGINYEFEISNIHTTICKTDNL